ncbi:MAG: lysine 2,3-aminomutase [Denitrovibrio sp.]|nr:MAG: lysine 2,3-aminomutase [Denitrovibrio sp.]
MSIYTETQEKLANKIDNNIDYKTWTDWKWQLRNTIKTVQGMSEILGVKFSEEEEKMYHMVIDKFPLAVTPYYASLIDKNNYKDDPVFKQAFGTMNELDVENYEMSDPLSEESDSPAKGLTHRYPDRVLLTVTGMCSMYCRHCTRKRKVGDNDSNMSLEDLEDAFTYIEDHPEVRDVLVSGGDPLMLSDRKLKMILDRISSIEHVEVIRIGTRMPVVLPYRITDELVEMLGQYDNLWLNTHFNHPREVTDSSKKALKKLSKVGIPLGNQSVLLAGVNDCPYIMKSLVHMLTKNRVRPYYLYQCDLAEGLSHFRTPISKGIEIIESLRGHTSGFAVPVYVVDAPGGGGKIPLNPNYIVTWATNKVILRNYEGIICTYKEPDSYEPIFCDRDCDECTLELNLSPEEYVPEIGIEKLICDNNTETTLTPSCNERQIRRSDDG